MNADAVFVADVHLCESRPAATGQFFEFLDKTALHAGALYILGDLFEAWVGDDALDTPLAQAVARHLADLKAHGVAVYFMHGNRDFMLAQRYAARCGMSLLPDPVVVDIAGTPTLLMHGDTLCTDDVEYQRFRRVVRHPLTLSVLRRLPLTLKRRLAGRARAGSERAKTRKSQTIMDVNRLAVEAVFRRHGVTRMIHGHTHRAAQHRLMVDAIPRERWVLPDWYDARGGYIVCAAAACRLITGTQA
jgi:UDP-2,3-diacylglucosamine hydrolase